MNKLKFRILFLISLLAISLLSFDQASYAQVRCVTVEAEKLRREKYKFLPSEEEFENWMAKKIDERRNKLIPFRTSGTGDPDKIAVVVHVIHNDEPYGVGANITNEQILSQIEVLNEDYQRNNADTINTQTEFLNVASNLNIEFVLARQSESGEPTTGIVRVAGEKSSYNPLSIADRELLSSYSQWDPNIYLNIWVTDLRSPYIGLAQFPDYDLPGLEDEPNKDNEATDGMVIDYQAFGSEEKVPGLDLMSKYNLGRTSTHEIGHFFGLKHVWGDGGCAVDDYVADTPNSDNDYSGLCDPSSHESCGSNDMFENFLNYTNDACMNIFTLGQVVRMETILDEAPRRASLLNSIGTMYPENMYFDLAVQSIESPGKVVCEGTFEPIVKIKNNGTVPVVIFDIEVSLNEVKQTYTYQGDTIFSGEIIDLILPESPIEAGDYLLAIELSDIPDDVNESNNTLNHVFVVDSQTDFIPLREQFEVSSIDATNWITINEDNDIGWKMSNAPSFSDENMAVFLNFYNYEDRLQLDWLISPSLDFSEALEASVTFKTSYAKNLDYNDQLRIMASSDCGATFDNLLEVFNSDELSIMDSEEFWEPVDQNEWTTQSVDLAQYAGKTNIRLAFVGVNDYGNNLFIDDIEFFATAKDKIVKTAQGSFTLYPNPTSDGQVNLAFNTSRRQNVEVFVYDQMGKLMTKDQYPNTLNQTYHYDLYGYRSGVYFFHSIGEDFVRVKRLVITK